MLYVLLFGPNIINRICVHQLLALVQYDFLWLGEIISIDAMLIRKIMKLPYLGLDAAEAFVGKDQD